MAKLAYSCITLQDNGKQMLTQQTPLLDGHDKLILFIVQLDQEIRSVYFNGNAKSIHSKCLLGGFRGVEV